MNGCGTYAGYQTHQRRGEPTCAECRAANAAYIRRYRRRRRLAEDADRADETRQRVAS
jgi:hypothetical protein